MSRRRWGGEAYVVNIGQSIRQTLGVETEEQLKEKLSQIKDPEAFDAQFYQNLPEDRTCVIDGKLATIAGLRYIEPTDREIVTVDLTSHPLISAKRITQRETGQSFPETVLNRDSLRGLLARYVLIQERATHDSVMRSRMESKDQGRRPNRTHKINSGELSYHEAVGLVVSGENDKQGVPDWELEALWKTVRDLQIARDKLGSKVHPADDNHFRYNFESIKNKIDRLSIMMADTAISSIRHDIKDTVIDGWSSLMMKHTPRFFIDHGGNLSVDNRSQRWTPEHYKIAEAWPIFSTLLKDKTILDPFAGAGTLVNLLASREAPKEVYTTDLSYEDGRELEGLGKFYAPKLNRKMWELLFDDLPSWYKPSRSIIKEPIASDVRILPFEDKTIDYIVTDPPYGKNCSGGCDLLVDSINEMRRVTREGSILLIPTDWVDKLQTSGIEVKQLTLDVSRGSSSLATCYVYIPSSVS